MIVGIVGLGLIGGSLGLELRSQGYRVLGVSRQAATCERAMARGAVDGAAVDYGILASADLVFLCPPIGAIPATLTQLLPHLQPQAILTDVGSVKASIVEAIAPHWPRFIGGHPMAGTADQGIEAAHLGLFRDAPYILTPTATTPPDCVEAVAEVVQSLGSHLYTCSPTEHDQAVAAISHLPVFVSAALIASCDQEPNPKVRELAQQFASSGFRDTSRVGGGNPELGRMMAQYNATALGRSLRAYRDRLDHLITQLEQQNWDHLEAFLTATAAARPAYVAPHPPPSPPTDQPSPTGGSL